MSGEKTKNINTMSNEPSAARSHEKWARFRFSLVGPLLAAPPKRGELKAKLQELAPKSGFIPLAGNGPTLVSPPSSGGITSPSMKVRRFPRLPEIRGRDQES